MRAAMVAAMVFAMASSALAGVEVPVSVTEPAGVARAHFPATGGIPFKPGTVKDVSELVLVDSAGKPVPAQFSKLAGYDDGSVQWALVDVLADVPANGKTAYTLKTGGVGGQPAEPLKITETDAAVTVDTGVVRFTVSKVNFALFDEVVVGGRKVVTGGSVDLLNCELGPRTARPHYAREDLIVGPKEGGKVFLCKAGKPARVKWEYRGAVRATLRVDGDYLGDGGAPLSYTTRVTAWAGSGAVRVEHSIRNFNPAAGTDAYIKRATLTLKLAFDAQPQAHEVPKPMATPRPPDPPATTTQAGKVKPPPDRDHGPLPCDDWCSGGDGAVGVMIQNRHSGGVYRGPGSYLVKITGCGWDKSWPGLFVQSVKGDEAVVELVSQGPQLEGKAAERGALGFTGDGTFALADRSHKDSEVWFDFYAGSRDVAANEARATACRSRLLLVAPGEWYSEAEALGGGHFGTLADEIATYKLWGWKGWDDQSKYPRMAHQPLAFVPMEAIHDVSEDDAVEGYLLQFLRTGERGFFDWAEAYAGLYRCHAIFRDDSGPAWGTPATGVTVQVDAAGNSAETKKPLVAGQRPNKGLGFGWYGPELYDWADSRMHYCHHYGRGIFDYYCLTGNTDALEAGLNLAGEMSRRWEECKPGSEFAFGRTGGRKWTTVIRAYQLTRDPQWKQVADRWADHMLQAPNWDGQNNVYLQSMGGYYSYFAREWAEQRPGREGEIYVVPPRLLKYLADHGITIANVRGKAIASRGEEKWEVFHLTQVFELSSCHLAMERYARVMNSEPMKKRLVDVTRGVIKYYWSDHCQFMRDRGFLNWPDKDKPLDYWRWIESHDKCPKDPCGMHAGYSTRYIADMCARAYSFSGERPFLDWSKTCWNRGSKRPYSQDSQIAGEDEVGIFSYIRGAHNDTIVECSARLFYEWPRAK